MYQAAKSSGTSPDAASQSGSFVATYLWDDGSGPAHFEPLVATVLQVAIREADEKVPSHRRFQRLYDQSLPGQPTVWSREQHDAWKKSIVKTRKE